eukprot:TRINITY_DN5417_c0_g1_i2.p1 TRINITY_DN5417_c0_g1~~TRINITY_DN5417_c0_g1_i2.p1  ORF type:complete len:466 (+),score=77.99 TRINITY_DN5417_c0_g1_i2:90-1487(+)
MKRGPSDENDGISEYEKIRLKNIEERCEKLASLGIALPNSEPAPKKSRVSSKPTQVSSTPPIRYSSRLRGIDAKSLSAVSAIGQEILETPSQEEEEFSVPREKISLNNVLKLQYEPGAALEEKSSSFKSTLQALGSLQFPEETSSFRPKELRIHENGARKIIPVRIASMAFHSSLEPLLLAAGDKYGNVALWNLSDREKLESFRPHEKSVNCMSFDFTHPSRLVTTSYDGSVRQLDLKSESLELLYDTEESFTSYHSQMDANQYLITLGKGGYVGIVDTRRSSKRGLSSKIHVFADSSYAKTVSYKNNLLVCGNSKSNCLVYDIRNPKNPSYELLGHTGSVSSAFFNPSSSSHEVLSTDYKDMIRLYELSESGNKVHPKWSFSHNNHTGRWLSTLKAVWHPNQPYFCLGSMQHPRQVNVFDSNGDKVRTLSGEILTSTATVVIPHPYANVLASGNSSGKVYIFEE